MNAPWYRPRRDEECRAIGTLCYDGVVPARWAVALLRAFFLPLTE